MGKLLLGILIAGLILCAPRLDHWEVIGPGGGGCDLKHNFAVWQAYALIGRDYIAGPRELGFLPREPEGLSCFTDCTGDGLPFAATPRWEAIDDFVDGRIEAQPLELSRNIADIKR